MDGKGCRAHLLQGCWHWGTAATVGCGHVALCGVEVALAVLDKLCARHMPVLVAVHALEDGLEGLLRVVGAGADAMRQPQG